MYKPPIMQFSMKNPILSGTLAFAALAVILAAAPRYANAQARFSVNGCPAATVYYQNGYSSNYCVPSYYPGYAPVYTQPPRSYPGYPTNNYDNGYNYGGGYGYSQPVFQPRYNPFQPPVYNQPFYPYTPVPTYYYPPGSRHWGRR